LPRLRQELGVGAARGRTGIDGVSLGGRYALLVGLTHPELFGAVGALQPAVREPEAEELAALARTAQDRGLEHLRLVTSDEDYFKPAVEALAEALRRKGVRHELLVTPGPHDYVYNRGPGSFEMLLWHERVLRSLPPP
jgi:enterochelin esterase-like enzyme